MALGRRQVQGSRVCVGWSSAQGKAQALGRRSYCTVCVRACCNVLLLKVFCNSTGRGDQWCRISIFYIYCRVRCGCGCGCAPFGHSPPVLHHVWCYLRTLDRRKEGAAAARAVARRRCSLLGLKAPPTPTTTRRRPVVAADAAGWPDVGIPAQASLPVAASPSTTAPVPVSPVRARGVCTTTREGEEEAGAWSSPPLPRPPA